MLLQRGKALSFSGRAGRARRKAVMVRASLRSAKRIKYASTGSLRSEPLVVTVQPDGSDTWRLAPVIQLLKEGGVGIIPTDTLPAIVCDLEHGSASRRLYAVKEMDPKKPLSILCRSFSDISHYTTGFPTSTTPGQPNWFKVVKNILPGPYTIILPATKNLPSQMVNFLKGQTIHRKSVGCRLPGDPVCQAVLEGLDYPLLCTSVHVPDVITEDTEVPDVGQMLELYGNRGIDFVVDVGRRVATSSTVVDMTTAEPEVLRVGGGDPSVFERD